MDFLERENSFLSLGIWWITLAHFCLIHQASTPRRSPTGNEELFFVTKFDNLVLLEENLGWLVLSPYVLVDLTC